MLPTSFVDFVTAFDDERAVDADIRGASDVVEVFIPGCVEEQSFKRPAVDAEFLCTMNEPQPSSLFHI